MKTSIKTRIKSIFKILFIVVILFIATVMIINTSPFDEQLNPNVIKILQPQPKPPVQGNAYYALMGINANASENINLKGFDIIQQYINNSQNEVLNNDKQEEFSAVTTENNHWLTEYTPCDLDKNIDCLTELSTQLTENSIDNNQLIHMLKRYEEIINMPTYKNYIFDTFDAMPTAPYSELIKLSQIKLSNDYLSISNTQFLKNLNADIKFWKMALDNSSYLIDKMVAISAIKNDIKYTSEFIRNTSINEKDLPLLKALLIPLTSSQLDLSKSFVIENRMIFKMSQNLESEMGLFSSLFYQPNATLNYHYQNILKPQLKISKLSIKDFIQFQKEETNILSEKQQKLRSLNPSNLYNYIGKVLVAFAGCACSDYMAKGYNLNNTIKMVQIQLQAKLSSSQPIQEIIAKPQNINPFNNKPFDYDTDTQTLHFDCLYPYSKCQIRL